jgi:opacity protein-like surface antigen
VLKDADGFFFSLKKLFCLLFCSSGLFFYREKVMLKKLVIAMTSAALLVGSSLSFAHYGVYLGADVGGNAGSWTTKDNYGVNTKFSSRALIGTIFAGYGYNADHFYLGAEAFFNQAANKTGTKNIDAGTVQRYASQKYGYGLSLMPGIAITDGALIFGRIGVVRTYFQVNDSSAIMSTPSSSNSITGSQAGAGVQLAMTPSLDARAEYIYSIYGSTNNADGKFTPRNNQANLGLVYKFE